MSHGRICWFDLYTDRVDAAMAFYAAVAGWTYQTDNHGDGPYSMIHDGTGFCGGMMTVPHTPPHWQPYATVEDCDDATEYVRALGGGVVVGPMDVGDVGRMSIVTDPTGGGHLGIIRLNDEAPPRGREPQHGEFGWQSLLTNDLDASAAFWCALLGWTVDDAGPPNTDDPVDRRLFRRDGVPVAGLHGAPRYPGPSRWHVAIEVADIEAAHATALTGGATEVMPVTPLGPDRRFFVVTDPVGAMISFSQGR